MLKTYFDDSNGDAVGGCVAAVEAWERFEPEWLRALNDFRVDWFHATSFENRGDGYKHLTDPERTYFLKRLLKVLGDTLLPFSGRGGYACSVAPRRVVRTLRNMAAGYRKIRKPQGQRTFIDHVIVDLTSINSDEYAVCLGQCFRLAIDNFAGQFDEPMHLFVADQPKKNGKVALVYAMAKANPRFERYLSGLSNGPEMNPRTIIPLQAADFAAYYLSKREREPSNSRWWVADALRPQFVTSYGLVTKGWKRR